MTYRPCSSIGPFTRFSYSYNSRLLNLCREQPCLRAPLVRVLSVLERTYVYKYNSPVIRRKEADPYANHIFGVFFLAPGGLREADN